MKPRPADATREFRFLVSDLRNWWAESYSRTGEWRLGFPPPSRGLRQSSGERPQRHRPRWLRERQADQPGQARERRRGNWVLASSARWRCCRLPEDCRSPPEGGEIPIVIHQLRLVLLYPVPRVVAHSEKSNLKTRGSLSNWRRILLFKMVIKVSLLFLRLFPLERQIESNPLYRRVVLSKRKYFYFRVGLKLIEWPGRVTARLLQGSQASLCSRGKGWLLRSSLYQPRAKCTSSVRSN